MKANKEMNLLATIVADAACVVYEFVEEQMIECRSRSEEDRWKKLKRELKANIWRVDERNEVTA